MKPLYHCATCGRVSTRLGSFRCIEAQLYCKREECMPTPDSEELSKLISDIEAERVGLVTWVRGGYVPLDTRTLLSALRLAASSPMTRPQSHTGEA